MLDLEADSDEEHYAEEDLRRSKRKKSQTKNYQMLWRLPEYTDRHHVHFVINSIFIKLETSKRSNRWQNWRNKQERKRFKYILHLLWPCVIWNTQSLSNLSWRQDKWKRERCAHQATGQATVQWCPDGEQSRPLYQWREISERETAACTDRRRVQSTDGIGALWKADVIPRDPCDRVESQTAWSKTDRTTCRRITWSNFEVPEASRGSGNCQSGSRSYYYQRDRGHRELPDSTRGTRTAPCFICGVSHGRWTGQWDVRVASKHSIINRQTRAGEQQYRQRCSCTIPSRSAGTSTSA